MKVLKIIFESWSPSNYLSVIKWYDFSTFDLLEKAVRDIHGMAGSKRGIKGKNGLFRQLELFTESGSAYKNQAMKVKPISLCTASIRRELHWKLQKFGRH